MVADDHYVFYKLYVKFDIKVADEANVMMMMMMIMMMLLVVMLGQ